MTDIYLLLKENKTIKAKGWYVQNTVNCVFIEGPNRNQRDSDNLVIITILSPTSLVVELTGNGTVTDRETIVEILSQVAPRSRILSSPPEIAR